MVLLKHILPRGEYTLVSISSWQRYGKNPVVSYLLIEREVCDEETTTFLEVILFSVLTRFEEKVTGLPSSFITKSDVGMTSP